jgi:hypothetical protein
MTDPTGMTVTGATRIGTCRVTTSEGKVCAIERGGLPLVIHMYPTSFLRFQFPNQ